MSGTEEEKLLRQLREAEEQALARLRESEPEPTHAPDDDKIATIDEVNRVVDAERGLRERLGRQPTVEEIAAESGLSADDVARTITTAPPPIQFDND